MSQCQRVFLGWDKPFLESASDWLWTQSSERSHIDLSQLTILATVNRAARHLVEKLVFRAEKMGAALSPPNFISLGSLFSSLLPDRVHLTALDTQLIFLEVLRDSDPSLIRALFPALPSINEDVLFDRAAFLSDLYQELTKNGQAAVQSIERAISLGVVGSEERWLALSRVFVNFNARCADLNLCDSQKGLELLQTPGFRRQESIILLATFDLVPIIKESILAGYNNVTALIFAPESDAEGFDELGLLFAPYWLDCRARLSRISVEVYNRSQDQAFSLVNKIAKISNVATAADVTIGALETGMDKHLESAAAERGLRTHLPNQMTLLDSEPGQFLMRALRFRISGSLADLSSLFALPSVSKCLPSSSEALQMLNTYREEHLQPRVNEALPVVPAALAKDLEETEQMLAELKSEKPLALSEWIEKLNLIVDRVFPVSDARQSFKESLNKLITGQVQPPMVIETLAQLIRMHLASISDQAAFSIDDESDTPPIDIVGWLEVALDDAAFTFLTGFNESFLPASAGQNSFLPDSLRQKLGLEGSTQRLARDSYMLQTMCSSKKNFSILSSRLSLQDEPLLPCRLILGGNAEDTANIVEQFFRTQASETVDKRAGSQGAFAELYKKNLLPQNKKRQGTCVVSVTALSDYLRCPYLFYLRHVLKCEPAAPQARELSALQFGSLMHHIVAEFSSSKIISETSEEKILRFLLSQLDKSFNREFGKQPFAEVLVQYHQMSARLRAYAEWQAEWTSQGWQPWKIECSFSEPGFKIETPSGTAFLKGRIDRIDYNAGLDEYVVLDFKSAERAASPASAFSKKRGWLDLQLPIYSFYCERAFSTELKEKKVHLALLPISSRDESLSAKFAKWDDEKFQSAREAMHAAVEGIITQNFWPPKLPPEQSFEFASIYRAAA